MLESGLVLESAGAGTPACLNRFCSNSWLASDRWRLNGRWLHRACVAVLESRPALESRFPLRAEDNIMWVVLRTFLRWKIRFARFASE